MQEHASMPKEVEYEVPDTVGIERTEETPYRPPMIRDIPQQLRSRKPNTNTRQTLIDPKKTSAIDEKLAHRIPEDMNSDITVEEMAPLQDFYRETSFWFNKVNEEDILRKRYPKEDEIDKMTTPIRTKASRDYHLPLTARELRQAQLQSTDFKNSISGI